VKKRTPQKRVIVAAGAARAKIRLPLLEVRDRQMTTQLIPHKILDAHDFCFGALTNV
jgi:hypothetical protein